MKRWRPPRPLLLMALLLLAGAVINVLVSLACAAPGGGKLRDREEFVRQWSVVHKAEWEYNRRRPEPYKPTVGGGQGFVTASDFGLRMSLMGRESDCSLTIDTGWPAPAMRYAATYADGVRLTSGVRWPGNDGLFDACCGGIPTAPLPGFAINTLFYAAILAIGWSDELVEQCGIKCRHQYPHWNDRFRRDTCRINCEAGVVTWIGYCMDDCAAIAGF